MRENPDKLELRPDTLLFISFYLSPSSCSGASSRKMFMNSSAPYLKMCASSDILLSCCFLRESLSSSLSPSSKMSMLVVDSLVPSCSFTWYLPLLRQSYFYFGA